MDSFLLTYQVNQQRLLYDIGSSIEPLSIRDQIFRGTIIIERALADGLIQPDQEKPVLIIGAGVAGALAATTAVKYRVPVVLVEVKTPFIRQFHCRSRFVCPTQYDWPAPHWRRGRYPWWENGKLPLEWDSNYASMVVQAWDSNLKLMQLLNPTLLRIRNKRKFIRHNIVSDGQAVEAYFDPPLDGEPLLCSMVISCAGIGIERHWVPNEDPTYTGYGFWELDEFEKPDLGLDNVRPKVLISGSGDGALQDFLRLTTGFSSAGHIYEKVIDDSIKPEVERLVMIAEDYAHRSYVWGKAGVLDHAIQFKLHTEYEKIIEMLFNEWKFRRRVEKALAHLIGNLDKRLAKIKLAYPCDHFSSCFALNRFLVLLIAKYIHRNLEYNPLSPRIKILEVRGVDPHHCLNDAHLCYGQEHELIRAEAFCNTFLTAGANEAERSVIADGPYRIVIIRHGIKINKPPLGNLPAAAPPRQILPYDIPW
ncbi:MAG: hypothetical protein WCF57_05365 [Pyrinomonadaceae bacterium]